MDHTSDNIGRIASALYSTFKTVRVFDEGLDRPKHRFAITDGRPEQILTGDYLALRYLDWVALSPFVKLAIKHLNGGALEVAVTPTGVDVIRRP